MSTLTRSVFAVVAKVLDREVSEFELQSCYHVHFWTNTFRKGIEPYLQFID